MRSDRKNRWDGWIVSASLFTIFIIATAGRMLGTANPVTYSAAPVKTNLSDQLIPYGDSILININTADEALLMTLPGIGPALSARIIDYREANGSFDSVNALMNVSGIGAARLNDIRDMICVPHTAQESQRGIRRGD